MEGIKIMSQLSYTQDYVVAQVGQIADISNRVIDSFAAEGTIAFGIAVARGTNKQKQVIPFAGTGFVGISVFTHDGVGEYADEASVPVMTSGRIYVTTAVTVVAGMKIGAVLNNVGALVTVATTADASYVLIDERVKDLSPGTHNLLVLSRGPVILKDYMLTYGTDVDTDPEKVAVHAALKAKGLIVEKAI